MSPSSAYAAGAVADVAASSSSPARLASASASASAPPLQHDGGGPGRCREDGERVALGPPQVASVHSAARSKSPTSSQALMSRVHLARRVRAEPPSTAKSMASSRCLSRRPGCPGRGGSTADGLRGLSLGSGTSRRRGRVPRRRSAGRRQVAGTVRPRLRAAAGCRGRAPERRRGCAGPAGPGAGDGRAGRDGVVLVAPDRAGAGVLRGRRGPRRRGTQPRGDDAVLGATEATRRRRRPRRERSASAAGVSTTAASASSSAACQDCPGQGTPGRGQAVRHPAWCPGARRSWP